MAPRILIVGPAWIGDTIMAQGLFKLLKQQTPDCVLDVLAPEWTFSVLQRMPEVDNAINMPMGHGQLQLKKRWQLAQTLRAHQYDQAIVLPNSFKSALIPWFAGIPKRTGWRGERRYLLLNDCRKLDKIRYPLMLERFLALALPPNTPFVSKSFYPSLVVTTENQLAAQTKFVPNGQHKPILGLSPGAAFGPAKRWPAAYFAKVANQKISEGFAIWLFGAKEDEPIIQVIQQLTNYQCRDFSGKTTLAETIDLVSLTAGVVTNDSGLMHIASALNKSVIAIYGPTSPAFTPPLSPSAVILRQQLPCQPCFARTCPLEHHRCLQDLLPETVLLALQKEGL